MTTHLVYPAKEDLNRRLAVLNQWDIMEACFQLGRCCASSIWVKKMVASRPFLSMEALWDCADRSWNDCSHEDWLEAFATHPRIGERGKTQWSQHEQSGALGMSQEVHEALASANHAYETKFGYTFIIYASGKSAGEILAVLKQRLGNSPAREIYHAAEQQRLITHLRLHKLLHEIHYDPRS